MKNELLALLAYWEREKGIDRRFLLTSLEKGLLTVYRKKAHLPDGTTIRIDAETGEIRFLDESGGELPSPSFPWERIAAQTAKQVLIQKIREAEKNAIYEEFKKLEGQILSGRVERIESGHMVLSFGKAEGLLPHHHRLPSDHFRIGNTVKAYVIEVRRPNRGNYQVIVSRTHAEFVAGLLAGEIPEIKEGIVVVKALARFPGDLTKIAVHSISDRVDPVGTCIGDKAIRVKNITRELSGEKIEIIPWSENPEKFILHSLSPATAEKILLNHGKRDAVVLVRDDQLYLAIGKRGQNVRLASKLTGWTIRVYRTSEYSETERPAICVLEGIDEPLGRRLLELGYSSIRSLAEADPEDIVQAASLPEETVHAIIARAREHLTAGHQEGTEHENS